MKRILLVSLLVVLTLVASLVAHMPARFVMQYAPMPRDLSIEGIQGTLWQGSAQHVHWQGSSLGQVQWDVHAPSLLLGLAQANVRFGQGSEMGLRGRGLVGIGFSGAFARKTIASIPAQFAVNQLALPLPLDLEGQLELSIEHVLVSELNQPIPVCQQGSGTLVWSGNRAVTPIAELDLGPAVVNFSCEDNFVSMKGQQQSEQVSAEFEATVAVNDNNQFTYQSKGWFKPEAEFPSNLSAQLKWLGNPDNQGRYPLSFNGTL
ncbi:type II secretion system protein N [uncultured Vibrio sp.]|uniref:type II secretion system protein N n=1 Tax=uncultured Vibrio sp. TaxID=114054 RepID=UPI0025F65B79|nr:type II secretion system protein N [uncultured Vibrio sp.]